MGDLQIKQAIKKRGLTIKEVAHRMGISHYTLSRHINGNPSVEILRRISDVLQCHITELFDTNPNCNICNRMDCEKRLLP